MNNIPEYEIIVKPNKKVPFKNLYKITSSKDAYDIVMKIYDENMLFWKEEFFVLILNNANRVIGYRKISSGSKAGTVVSDIEILLLVTKSLGAGFILIHNHPSGNIEPSQHDIKHSDNIAKLMSHVKEIKYLDNIIVSPENYYSFADEDMIENTQQKKVQKVK